MPLVFDQWALAKICVRDMPASFIYAAEAEQTLFALNRVVSIQALVMVNNSNFANVDDRTGWKGLLFDINNLARGLPSAFSK